jgi:23S rRNA pseudouridine1911/1915/1917 synthase
MTPPPRPSDSPSPRQPSPAPSRRARVAQPDPLLAAIVAAFDGVTRTKAKSLLAHGAVRLNGRADVRHDTPVAAGDLIELLPSPSAASAARPGLARPLVVGRPLPFPILFEDDDLIAIDKPHGLLTVATDAGGDRTAHRILGDHAAAEGWPAGRVFVVHRLDRDTSGVCVFAKIEEAKHALQEAWGATEKEYAAVVEGVPEEREGRLVDWVFEEQGGGLRVHVVDEHKRGAVEAVTRYRVEAEGNGRALLAVWIETGRRHQIRVQLAAIGHPVCGDPRYGPKAKAQARVHGGTAARRLALHATRLSFLHPRTGGRIELRSPPPAELTRLLRPAR